MSQFIPGDVITTKSGVFYVVLWADQESLGVTPVHGGSQRRVKIANVTLKSEQDLTKVTAPGFQEALEATVASVRKGEAQRIRREELNREDRRRAALEQAQQEAAADDEARTLSPMDRERQVRRMAAEIRAHQPEQRWAALNLAAALYDAGFRATDPGHPLG